MGRLFTVLRQSAAAAWSPLSRSPAQWINDTSACTDTALTTQCASDGDPVAGWKDLSGSGRHWLQATGANKPAFRTNVQNGRPAILGDGAASSLGRGTGTWDWSGITAATVAFVARALTTGNCIMKIGNGSNFHYPFSDNKLYDNTATTSRKDALSPTRSLTANWNVYVVRSQAGQWDNWQNGVNIFSTGTNAVGFVGGSDTALFRTDYTSGTPLYWNGYIGELMVFPSYLSDADRQLVETYLTTRWGIS